MITEIITVSEYHPNGQLFYQEKRGLIDGLFIDAYRNTTTLRCLDNQYYIKLESVKYYDNGQMAWILIWDENGILTNNKEPQYRKDGSIIN